MALDPYFEQWLDKKIVVLKERGIIHSENEEQELGYMEGTQEETRGAGVHASRESIDFPEVGVQEFEDSMRDYEEENIIRGSNYYHMVWQEDDNFEEEMQAASSQARVEEILQEREAQSDYEDIYANNDAAVGSDVTDTDNEAGPGFGRYEDGGVDRHPQQLDFDTWEYEIDTSEGDLPADVSSRGYADGEASDRSGSFSEIAYRGLNTRMSPQGMSPGKRNIEMKERKRGGNVADQGYQDTEDLEAAIDQELGHSPNHYGSAGPERDTNLLPMDQVYMSMDEADLTTDDEAMLDHADIHGNQSGNLGSDTSPIVTVDQATLRAQAWKRARMLKLFLILVGFLIAVTITILIIYVIVKKASS